MVEHLDDLEVTPAGQRQHEVTGAEAGVHAPVEEPCPERGAQPLGGCGEARGSSRVGDVVEAHRPSLPQPHRGGRRRPPRTYRAVVAHLLRLRWLAGSLLVAAVAVAMAWAGAWQWGRSFPAESPAAAVPLHTVAQPGSALAPERVATLVEATGRYAAGGQRLVAGVDLDGRPGYLVVTPLLLGPDTAVIVDRGWMPAAGGEGSETGPPPPAGEVSVQGWLFPSEPPHAAPLPPGQVASVDTARLGAALPGQTYTAYLRLTDQSPPADSALRPAFVAPSGRGVSLQNLAYALQWWLFAGATVVGWVVVLRGEARRPTAGAAEAHPVAALR